MIIKIGFEHNDAILDLTENSTKNLEILEKAFGIEKVPEVLNELKFIGRNLEYEWEWKTKQRKDSK